MINQKFCSAWNAAEYSFWKWFFVSKVIVNGDCKRLDIDCRHSVALTGLDKHRKRVAIALFWRLEEAHAKFVNNGADFEARGVTRYNRRAIEEYLNISMLPHKAHIRYSGVRLEIDSESTQEGMMAANYRLKRREQLRRLEIDSIYLRSSWFRTGDSNFLISLECCTLGTRFLDLQQMYEVHHSSLCRGVNHFAGWKQGNWGYLLRDNIEFWSDHF